MNHLRHVPEDNKYIPMYIHTKIASSAPNYQFLRQRSTLLALHYCGTVSLEPYTLFSGFPSLGCSFLSSQPLKGDDIGCGNEQDTRG